VVKRTHAQLSLLALHPSSSRTGYVREMDALSRILQSVRLRGSILSIAELAPPFGVQAMGRDSGAVFHAVVEGRAILTASGGTFCMAAGDVALLARGQPHAIADEPGRMLVPVSSLERSQGPVLVLRNAPSRAPTTRIVCGVFRLEHAASDSLLSLLPEVLHHEGASAQPEAREWVGSTVRMLDAELRHAQEGASAIAARLCDVLLVQLLRSSPLTGKGWLAALRDPQIGRALALIHEDPGTRWDAAVLAARVGMSRSRFFARFTELVGEPPVQYLSRWRMSVAADVLMRDEVTVPELAERSGYASEEAFVRVFKRHFGKTPSAYRREREAAH